jgi:transcriptional regulator with GAF, ATPase, and Fis domain
MKPERPARRHVRDRADLEATTLRRVGIADVLTQVALEINAPSTVDATLDRIVHTARRSLPGIDHVGVSVSRRDGGIETRAATGDLVLALDELQYRLNEGPCLYAIAAATVVRVEDAAHDERWPRYMPEAVRRGVRSQLGLQLGLDGETLGGLNLYSTSVDRFDDEVLHTAELFAVHAALAMGRARTEEQLRSGMSSRSEIGQALGLLMERYSIDGDAAFAFLSRASSVNNTKLRDVAAEIVADANARFGSAVHEQPSVVEPGRPGDVARLPRRAAQ